MTGINALLGALSNGSDSEPVQLWLGTVTGADLTSSQVLLDGADTAVTCYPGLGSVNIGDRVIVTRIRKSLYILANRAVAIGGVIPLGEDGDRLYLADLTTQTWTLSATPVTETLVVEFHPDGGAGIEWKRNEHYTLDGDEVTILDTDLAAAGAAVDDHFSAQYLRLEGTTVSEAYTIGFSASGWSYLAVAGSPDDSTANYSMADSSGWSTGPSPLGGVAGDTGWAALATSLTTELLWIKRDVPATNAMTVTVRVEDNCKVYVNGSLVGTIPEHGTGYPPETAFVVPPSVLNHDTVNVVAVRVANETPPVVDDVYVDVKIEGTL